MAHKLTRADAARLLALAAAYDHRTTSETDDAAWADALYDLDPEDCAEAIRLHYRETDAWLMPSHVRQRVAYLREARANRLHDVELRRQIEAGKAVDRERVREIAQGVIRGVRETLGEKDPTPEQHAALTMRCPYCKAVVGRPCVNAVTQKERATPHPMRVELVPAR